MEKMRWIQKREKEEGRDSEVLKVHEEYSGEATGEKGWWGGGGTERGEGVIGRVEDWGGVRRENRTCSWRQKGEGEGRGEKRGKGGVG